MSFFWFCVFLFTSMYYLLTGFWKEYLRKKRDSITNLTMTKVSCRILYSSISIRLHLPTNATLCMALSKHSNTQHHTMDLSFSWPRHDIIVIVPERVQSYLAQQKVAAGD